MRRLFRWIFNFAAAVSALLFVGVCVLWVRSYWRLDTASACSGDLAMDRRSPRPFPPLGQMYVPVRGTSGYVLWAESEGGRLVLSRMGLRNPQANNFYSKTWGSYPIQSLARTRQQIEPGAGQRGGRFIRFAGWAYRERGAGPRALHTLVVPYWAVALTAGLLPALALTRRARSRALRRRGACPTCGYDLRATPDRCPECGHVPERKGTRA